MNNIPDFAKILNLDLLFFSLFDTLCYANFFALFAEAEVFIVSGYMKSAHQCIVNHTASLMTHQYNFQKRI